MKFFDEIKSNFIQKNILKHIKLRRILKLFKYNKYYQSKLNLNKEDFLEGFFDKLGLDMEKHVDFCPELIFKKFKKYIPKNISKEIFIKDIIQYRVLKEELCLSIDDIYFDEIITKKIQLNKKKLSIQIELTNKEYLSQNDIINMIAKNKNIEQYINEKIELYNKFFNKLEIIYNNFIVCGMFVECRRHENIIDIFTIDYNKDIIEYKNNQTTEEKNILISLKLKRAELINNLLEKNCKNMTKLKIRVLHKNITNKKIICPLIALERFDNLILLDLSIEGKEQNDPYFFQFTNNLKKLKNLKIETINLYPTCDIYIKKEILDKIETLKIRGGNWFISNNENFDNKNIKELDIESDIECCLKKNDINKKYFFSEVLEGNINFEKLKKLKLCIPYTKSIIEKKYKNEKIVDFINNANLRDLGDNTKSDFFPQFFKFIFENQIISPKTSNKKENNIKEFILKLHDNYGYNMSGYIPKINYKKINKNVSLNIGGSLYGINVFQNWENAPIKLIKFDDAKVSQNLDSFTIDNFSLEQLNIIKNLILSLEKKYEEFMNKYNEIFKKIRYEQYIKKEMKEKYVHDLDEHIESLKNKIKVLTKNMEEEILNKFEYKLKKIQQVFFKDKIRLIENLYKTFKYFPTEKKSKKKENKNNPDFQLSFDDFSLF